MTAISYQPPLFLLEYGLSLWQGNADEAAKTLAQAASRGPADRQTQRPSEARRPRAQEERVECALAARNQDTGCLSVVGSFPSSFCARLLPPVTAPLYLSGRVNSGSGRGREAKYCLSIPTSDKEHSPKGCGMTRAQPRGRGSDGYDCDCLCASQAFACNDDADDDLLMGGRGIPSEPLPGLAPTPRGTTATSDDQRPMSDDDDPQPPSLAAVSRAPHLSREAL
jgi:hypothetical protein